jgi:myo-inositol catabolism protein IolC
MKTLGYNYPLYIQVREWLTMAAGVEGFIGFAVGRTVFWAPLKKLLAKNIPRETAVSEITGHYWEFVGVFDDARVARDADYHIALSLSGPPAVQKQG